MNDLLTNASELCAKFLENPNDRKILDHVLPDLMRTLATLRTENFEAAVEIQFRLIEHYCRNERGVKQLKGIEDNFSLLSMGNHEYSPRPVIQSLMSNNIWPILVPLISCLPEQGYEVFYPIILGCLLFGWKPQTDEQIAAAFLCCDDSQLSVTCRNTIIAPMISSNTVVEILLRPFRVKSYSYSGQNRKRCAEVLAANNCVAAIPVLIDWLSSGRPFNSYERAHGFHISEAAAIAVVRDFILQCRSVDAVEREYWKKLQSINDIRLYEGALEKNVPHDSTAAMVYWESGFIALSDIRRIAQERDKLSPSIIETPPPNEDLKPILLQQYILNSILLELENRQLTTGTLRTFVKGFRSLSSNAVAVNSGLIRGAKSKVATRVAEQLHKIGANALKIGKVSEHQDRIVDLNVFCIHIEATNQEAAKISGMIGRIDCEEYAAIGFGFGQD